jgi:hypothetical protein
VNVWQSIKEYINSKKIGDTIYRKELIQHVYKCAYVSYPKGSYGSTLDNYRRLLTRLGILEHTNIGEYKIQHHIRNDLTTAHLQLLIANGMTLSRRS